MNSDALVKLVDDYLDFHDEEWDQLNDGEQKEVWIFIAKCFEAGIIQKLFFC